MRTSFLNGWKGIPAVLAVLLAAGGLRVTAQVPHHLVDGITGPAFTLTAKSGYLSTGEGNSVYFWGYANSAGPAQFSGPTLIVSQGATVIVTLHNELLVPTSIVFPGHKVTATGGTPGLLTREAPPTSGSVTYTFQATNPGTYTYYSGTRPDLQIEMGLVGALIVRPTGFNPANIATRRAYAHADSRFDQEYLFLLSDMDDAIHEAVEKQVLAGAPDITVDTTKYQPVYWFINGRNAPDTLSPANAAYLPNQPYNCTPLMHPGEKLLMRVIGAGRDPHPFHHHGNHARIIAHDGRLLESAAGAGADLSHEVFTITSGPGSTTDAIFTWTGKGLGWDMYGHDANAPRQPYEDPADHGKPFPVVLPNQNDLTFGQNYNGSPFLGVVGNLPPGQGGFNPTGGFMYMWHSHTEKEIVNNDIFPGGMLTLLLIEPWPAGSFVPPVPLP